MAAETWAAGVMVGPALRPLGPAGQRPHAPREQIALEKTKSLRKSPRWRSWPHSGLNSLAQVMLRREILGASTPHRRKPKCALFVRSPLSSSPFRSPPARRSRSPTSPRRRRSSSTPRLSSRRAANTDFCFAAAGRQRTIRTAKVDLECAHCETCRLESAINAGLRSMMHPPPGRGARAVSPTDSRARGPARKPSADNRR